MPLSGHGRAGCCPVFTGCRYSLIQDRIVCKTNYDNQVGSAHHVRIIRWFIIRNSTTGKPGYFIERTKGFIHSFRKYNLFLEKHTQPS